MLTALTAPNLRLTPTESKAGSPRPPKPLEPTLVDCGTQQDLGVKVTEPALSLQDAAAPLARYGSPGLHRPEHERPRGLLDCGDPLRFCKSTVLATVLGFCR